MVGSFRVISQPPQSGLESFLRIVAIALITPLVIDLYTPHEHIETYVNNHFKYEEQLFKRCHEKIEKGQIDDEVRAYLGREKNKFSGINQNYNF